MTDPNSFAGFLQQLAAAGKPSAEFHKRFNPRPPGVIQDGSTSAAILAFLRESGRFHSAASIRFVIKRGHSVTSWALIYLRSQGLIEAEPDTRRSARYLRYRAATAEEIAMRKVVTHADERTGNGTSVGINCAEKIAVGGENGF